METASFRIDSPNIRANSVLSASAYLNIDSTATGSVAEMRDPNRSARMTGT